MGDPIVKDITDKLYGDSDPFVELVELVGKRSELQNGLVKNRTKLAGAIDLLRAQGLSYRRIGQAVGLSGQRIEQMHKGR